MKGKILLLSIMACLLASCVKNQAMPTTNGTTKPSLPTAIDPDQDGDAKGVNTFPQKEAATGRNVFIFDPKLTAWAAYDANGNLVNTGRASGGRSFCPDVGRSCKTIVGTFKVLSKGDSTCESSIYPLETNGGAPMPYCMKFSAKGYAIHGSDYVPDYNASHGCIRVTPTAAAWLSQYFITNGTTVIVRSY
ncbi:MAG: enhanced entry protein EnhA [Gammaproteobacteria bacterium RIFCSPHIGHO2_12_FULL_35_23]|nr:MAG: enhanced entry protein EnhA [Gammaproteobacteria bacterium RIFCSPHIGHO2_12_FULL_35_23]